MKITVQAVNDVMTGDRYAREVALDRDLGIWGEQLVVTTSTGAEYTVTENDDGNLELTEHRAALLFAHNPSGNVVEILAAPTFAPHVIPDKDDGEGPRL